MIFFKKKNGHGITIYWLVISAEFLDNNYLAFYNYYRKKKKEKVLSSDVCIDANLVVFETIKIIW